MATIKRRNDTIRPDFYFIAAVLLTLFALVWLVGHEGAPSRNGIARPANRSASGTPESTGSAPACDSVSRVSQCQFCNCSLAEIELGV